MGDIDNGSVYCLQGTVSKEMLPSQGYCESKTTHSKKLFYTSDFNMITSFLPFPPSLQILPYTLLSFKSMALFYSFVFLLLLLHAYLSCIS